MNKKIENELTAIVKSENLLIKEPMSKHTTFHIGGVADYFLMPETIGALKQVLAFCKQENIPFCIVGNGSNLLVGDNGYRGVIIQLSRYVNRILIEDTKTTDREGEWCLVTAGAGVMLSKLAMEAAYHGLSGLEGEAGIPGTLGGAVTMNAGAYGYEIKDYLMYADVIDTLGEQVRFTKEALQLDYRTSIIKKESYVVTEAAFLLRKGKKEEILGAISSYNKRRKEKQPLEYASAGSTFKRPAGHFAGKLIMDAGLRGYRVGDIMISEKHCGFVVNVGNGTAKQVCNLIQQVQQRVYEQFGIHLEPEIRVLGEF